MARVDGKRVEGRALLESDEVVFRGTERAKVKLTALTRVEARGEALHLAWPGGALVLELGEAEAARWAEAIRNPKTRAQKLGVKAGARVSLLGVADDAVAAELRALGADVSTRTRKESDAVFVQIDDPRALDRIGKARASIKEAGAVWVVTPRGVPGLKDTDVMRAGKAAGLVDVKVVRFSETHSANKFVVPKAERRA